MSSVTEQVGRVVGGRYRLLTPIGAGASSQVFAALDTRLGRRVAVKLLHPTLAGDSGFLRRFRAEARLAASLDHPHVMRVFDWGEEAAGPYLVLELLPGGSLRALLDSPASLSNAQVASIGFQAASGLAYAHRRGIIHRDIKPGNLLFDDEGHLRIADFGVARAIAQAALTEPLGTMYGTARYASPEQAKGAPLDDRTDVYSLALVLYEALTGRVPFSSDTVSTMLMARVDAMLPPARELGPFTPILAAAAISEPLARLDAAGLASELEHLGRKLPPPGRLPLVRVELGPGVAGLIDRDPTDLDPGHPSRHEAGALFDGLAPIALDAPPEAGTTHRFETAVEGRRQLGTRGAAGPSGTEPSPAGAPRPRRRRVGLVLVSILVLVLAAVAAVLGYVRFGLYGHVVPSLVGDPVATAKAVAHDDGMKLSVGGEQYDLSVPAGAVVNQSVPAGRRERSGSTIVVTVSKGAPPVKVPDVTTWPQRQARSAISAAHLDPVLKLEYSETVRPGTVIDQDPLSSAASQPRGSRVILYISKGPHPRTVPDVHGVPLETAISDLHSVQLRWRQAPGQYSTSVPQGEVIDETPSAQSSVKRGSYVTLVVSLGEPYVKIPHLFGTSVQKAEADLEGLGLSVKIYGPHKGVVVYVDPTAGQSVREGSTVTLDTI